MNFGEGLLILIVAYLIYCAVEEYIKATKEVRLKELDHDLTIKEAAEYIEVLEAKIKKSKESKERK